MCKKNECFEPFVDVTGTICTPSKNGELCAGNGNGDAECCCDECDYYLYCYNKEDSDNEEYI